MSELDDLREEVAFWRRDAAARLTMARWALQNENAPKETRLRAASDMRSALAAFADADTKEWFGLHCDECGTPIEPGEQHFIAGDEDGGTVAYCSKHNYSGSLPLVVAEGTPADVANDVEAARAALKKWGES